MFTAQVELRVKIYYIFMLKNPEQVLILNKNGSIEGSIESSIEGSSEDLV